MLLDSSEGSSKSYSSPYSQGSTSPLLPRGAQESPITSRSTTPPLKPNIVEGNRLSHVPAWSDIYHVIERESDSFIRDSIKCDVSSLLCAYILYYISRYYMYLPLEKQKPCVNVMSHWEDRTYRMYNSNMLENIARLFVCSHTSSQTQRHECFRKAAYFLTSILFKVCFSFRRRVLPL